MKNQFTVKIINDSLISKFFNSESKTTKVYIRKDGTKYKDIKERNIRIQNKKKQIEKNVILDLYKDFKWDCSNLIQEQKIDKYLPDFIDKNTNTYFEIRQFQPYFYSVNDKDCFRDRSEHNVIALLNQKIFNSDNASLNTTKDFSDHLFNSIENAIKEKTIKYRKFNWKINLILYCVLQDISMHPKDVLWIYNNEEKFIRKIKQSVKTDKKLINFKWYGKDKVFSKIYLCFKSMIDENKYYDISLIINNC